MVREDESAGGQPISKMGRQCMRYAGYCPASIAMARRMATTRSDRLATAHCRRRLSDRSSTAPHGDGGARDNPARDHDIPFRDAREAVTPAPQPDSQHPAEQNRP